MKEQDREKRLINDFILGFRQYWRKSYWRKAGNPSFYFYKFFVHDGLLRGQSKKETADAIIL
jgi:hypothetical protein